MSLSLLQLAMEAITNIRTVAGLRAEEKFIDMYVAELAAPHSLSYRKAHFRGFIFGFSQVGRCQEKVDNKWPFRTNISHFFMMIHDALVGLVGK